MADGNFLPEADQDFLLAKEINYDLLSEQAGDELRRGVEFLDFPLPENLFIRKDGQLLGGQTVSVMVLIPKGYDKARLDSWHVWPPAFLANGQPANCASAETTLFSRPWQFWSRHLDAKDWREGIDGLETYFNYIQSGLREAQ